MRITALTSVSLPDEVAVLRPPESAGREVAAGVAGLVADVRARGDAAVVEATTRFDWEGASASALAVTAGDLEAAYQAMDPQVIAALETARDNCTFFHKHELTPDWEEEGAQGQKLGIRHLPVERAGLYVPGGLGSYASTVIMNAVPALVAGVNELVICTPPGRDGSVNLIGPGRGSAHGRGAGVPGRRRSGHCGHGLRHPDDTPGGRRSAGPATPTSWRPNARSMGPWVSTTWPARARYWWWPTRPLARSGSRRTCSPRRSTERGAGGVDGRFGVSLSGGGRSPRAPTPAGIRRQRRPHRRRGLGQRIRCWAGRAR